MPTRPEPTLAEIREAHQPWEELTDGGLPTGRADCPGCPVVKGVPTPWPCDTAVVLEALDARIASSMTEPEVYIETNRIIAELRAEIERLRESLELMHVQRTTILDELEKQQKVIAAAKEAMDEDSFFSGGAKAEDGSEIVFEGIAHLHDDQPDCKLCALDRALAALEGKPDGA